MPWRYYIVTAHDTKKPRKMRLKKWIKYNKPYKPQKRGAEKQPLWSSRFGFINVYNHKEQQNLKCPSGYSISQCFNVLAKLWHGYHRARLNGEGIEKVEKYAKGIQNVQKDMGIKTTSFPFLGLYGDVLILNDKNGDRIVYEDHSEMKKKQEEYERKMAENSKKIQERYMQIDPKKGETIETFADNVAPSTIYEGEYEDEDVVPNILEDEIDREAGESLLIMTDDIPFKNARRVNWNPDS